MLNVDRLMVSTLGLIAGSNEVGLESVVIGTFVGWTPAFIRCKWPWDVAREGTYHLRMKCGVRSGHGRRPLTAACTSVDFVGLPKHF